MQQEIATIHSGTEFAQFTSNDGRPQDPNRSPALSPSLFKSRLRRERRGPGERTPPKMVPKDRVQHEGPGCGSFQDHSQLHSPRSHRPQDHAAAEAWVHVGWPGAGAAAQPAVAAVGARAPQLAVEAAVPSHQCRVRVLAPLHPACMWQIRAWLDLQHVSNVNPL
jgi:hypothetical protein